jgi:hypothetical protein
VREKEGTGPFECYLTVMMMNGHQIEAAANVRLMLTKAGFDEVSCTAHSMNVRHNTFDRPCSAKAALVDSLAASMLRLPSHWPGLRRTLI